ncbi:MAG: hypothetical protein RBR67_02935 [Desulfobacterium sp.]|jgi:hypothetical protein|nr:hypothetical protein [Desulfobacterium sp.]
MKPLFFPFTHVTPEDRVTMFTLFNGFCHLSVTRPDKTIVEKTMHQNPAVEVLRPSAQEVVSALAIVEDYRQWAGINRGRAGQLKTRVPDTPYFTSDTGISTLKSSIERGAVSRAEPNSESDKLQEAFVKALVFLRMAQESDRETDQIDKGFTSIIKREAALFSTLKGNGLPLGDIPGLPGDHSLQEIDRGGTMTEQRILAWGSFFKKRMELSNPGEHFIPVTTSPAVLHYFKSTAKKSTKVLDIGNFKVHERSCDKADPWKNRLNKVIEDAVLGKDRDGKQLIEANDACALLADIQLYLFSDRGVDDIFCPSVQKGIKNRLIQGEGGEIPICLVHVRNKNA